MSSQQPVLPAGSGEVAGVAAGSSSTRAVPWFLPEFPKSVEILEEYLVLDSLVYSFSAGEHLASFPARGTSTGYSYSNCHSFLYRHLSNLLTSHLV